MQQASCCHLSGHFVPLCLAAEPGGEVTTVMTVTESAGMPSMDFVPDCGGKASHALLGEADPESASGDLCYRRRELCTVTVIVILFSIILTVWPLCNWCCE